MTTIAIVGAGPGLGAAVARRFGAETLWTIHTDRGEFRTFADELDA